jgi:hypothetical protein
MNSTKKCTLIVASTLLAASAVSPGVVVVLSDTVAPGPGGVLETFLSTSFANVTQIRHANFALFSAQATQDALNGTGTFAGMGAADVVIIGRSLASADYDNFDSAGYNALGIPVVSLTSYVVRQDGNRLGWHASGATTDKSVVGSETTVTALGASIFGIAEGTYDFALPPSGTDSAYNGLGGGTTAFGGGSILATIGGDTLAAYWAPGSAPGNPTAANVATFPAARLLFNLDNDLNGDLGNISSAGRQALASAIDFATPLNIPEPSSVLMLSAAVGLVASRRRRKVKVS